jgi:flagellar basal body-associated protein FliL
MKKSIKIALTIAILLIAVGAALYDYTVSKDKKVTVESTTGSAITESAVTESAVTIETVTTESTITPVAVTTETAIK